MRKATKLQKKGFILVIVILFCVFIFAIIQVRNYFSPKGILIDKQKYPITGIDLSKHNGVIDWEKIKKQKINFIYLKATEGQDYVDPSYYINLTRALKSNLKVGEYHFFRFNKSGIDQAQNFLAHALHDPGKLTPVLDIEEWGNIPVYKSNKEIKFEINEFLIAVETILKCKMIIYTNMDSYNRYIKGEFLQNPIWLCSFNKNPKLPDNRKWIFWQHAHNGKVAGIKGYVDINTFDGDQLAWKQYLSTLN